MRLGKGRGESRVGRREETGSALDVRAIGVRGLELGRDVRIQQCFLLSDIVVSRRARKVSPRGLALSCSAAAARKRLGEDSIVVYFWVRFTPHINIRRTLRLYHARRHINRTVWQWEVI